MRVYTFGFRITVWAVLSLFLWCYGPLFQIQMAWAASPEPRKTPQAQNEKPKPASASERFQAALEDIRESAGKAGDRVAKNEDTSSELETIKTKRTELDSLRAELKKEFDSTGKRLRDGKLPSEIISRHEKFVENFERNYKELQDALSAVEQAKKKEEKQRAYQKAKAFLEKTRPQRKNIPLDPSRLPHRAIKAKPKAPRLTAEEYQRDFPKQKLRSKQKVAETRLLPDLLASKQQPKPVLLAFNETASDITFSVGSDAITLQPDLSVTAFEPLLLAQAASNLPTPEDLASTPEINSDSPLIRAKAEELGCAPARLYTWTRNTIEFVPTYGSIQGAEMCLQTKQCNSIDTNSLLAALMRSCNIPARLNIGTIEVPIEKLMNWAGGFSDPTAALNYLASGGIPVTGLRSGGKIYAARLETAWLRVFVDYIPSRGAVHKEGDTFIPLDASFKQYTYKTGLDVQQITGFDPSAFANSLINSGVTDPATGSITGINATFIQTQIDAAKTLLETHIETLQDPTVGDIIGAKNIIQEDLELLPASLPYKTILTGSEFADIPDSLRYKVGISIYDPQTMAQSMSVTYSTAYLAGKRITLAYMPATQTDAQTLETYGYYNTKPYLVNLKPVLKIDGITVNSGGNTGMGMMQDLTVTFIPPNGSTDMVTHKIPASTYASLGLDLQRVSKSLLDNRNAQLSAAVNLLGQQDVAVDDILGETLNLHNLGYFSQVETTNRMLATGKVAYSKQPAEMLTTLAPTISYLYGVPYSIGSIGTNIDVKRYPMNVISLQGNMNDEIAFMTASGTSGSAYEHTIIEELHQDAQGVSAVKIISIANQQGIPIYTIDSSNSATVLPRLRISSETMSNIQNAIAAGMRVIIPEQSIQYFDWHGEGFIVTDPSSGAAAYMLSGGLAGGGTSSQLDQLSSFFSDMLKNFAFDFTKALITFLFKAGAGVASKLASIAGYITMGLSAIKTYNDMFDATGGDSLKAKSAAVLDLAMSVMASIYIGAIMFAATGFGAAVAGILLVAIIATLIEMLFLALIEYASVPSISRKKYFAMITSPWRYCYAA